MESCWQHLAVLLVMNLLFVLEVGAASSDDSNIAQPADGDSRLVVNTWTGDFSSATARAWDVLRSKDGSVLDAVEQVCPFDFFSGAACWYLNSTTSVRVSTRRPASHHSARLSLMNLLFLGRSPSAPLPIFRDVTFVRTSDAVVP